MTNWFRSEHGMEYISGTLRTGNLIRESIDFPNPVLGGSLMISRRDPRSEEEEANDEEEVNSGCAYVEVVASPLMKRLLCMSAWAPMACQSSTEDRIAQEDRMVKVGRRR